MKLQRRGGLIFWRIGPLGGSLYWSSKPAVERAAEAAIRREKAANTRRQMAAFRRLPYAAWPRFV